MNMYFSVASGKVKYIYSNIEKLLLPYIKNDSETYWNTTTTKFSIFGTWWFYSKVFRYLGLLEEPRHNLGFPIIQFEACVEITA